MRRRKSDSETLEIKPSQSLEGIAARAEECKLVADAMEKWIFQLKPGAPSYVKVDIPKEAEGVGLTEAPRGALGHWISIKDQKIDNYQVVAATIWNASPRDDKGTPGPH